MKLPGPHLWKPALATPHWRPAARHGGSLAQTTTPASDDYSTAVLVKLTGFGVGAVGGLAVGALFNALMPSIRESRGVALVQAGMAATLGALAIALPFTGTVSRVTDLLALLSGVTTGNALASVALPRKRAA